MMLMMINVTIALPMDVGEQCKISVSLLFHKFFTSSHFLGGMDTDTGSNTDIVTYTKLNIFEKIRTQQQQQQQEKNINLSIYSCINIISLLKYSK